MEPVRTTDPLTIHDVKPLAEALETIHGHKLEAAKQLIRLAAEYKLTPSARKFVKDYIVSVLGCH